MDIKKLNPWNWFSREEPAHYNLPVTASQTRSRSIPPMR